MISTDKVLGICLLRLPPKLPPHLARLHAWVQVWSPAGPATLRRSSQCNLMLYFIFLIERRAASMILDVIRTIYMHSVWKRKFNLYAEELLEPIVRAFVGTEMFNLVQVILVYQSR